MRRVDEQFPLALRGERGGGLIHGERPQHLTGGAENRMRPAGAQAEGGGDGPEVVPERIVGDIADDDRLRGVCRRATRPDPGTDHDPVDLLDVRRRERRRGPMAHARLRLVKQQDRAERPRADAFDPLRHASQDVGERTTGRDRLQQEAKLVHALAISHPLRGQRGHRAIARRGSVRHTYRLLVLRHRSPPEVPRISRTPLASRTRAKLRTNDRNAQSTFRHSAKVSHE